MIGAGRWAGVWSASRDAWLIQLWDEGHSASEIGRRMDCSKNSVVGRVHRLKLPARPSPIALKDSGKPKAAAKRAPNITIVAVVAKPPPKPESPVEVVAKPVNVYVGRIRECEWPLTDGQPWRFCCDPTSPGRSYCAEHLHRSVVRVRPSVGVEHDKEATAP